MAERTPQRKARPARKWSTWFAVTVRWLHIYMSLLGFTALIFFSITGITLNHPTWFSTEAQHVTANQGTMPVAWLRLPPNTAAQAPDNPPGDESLEVDHAREVDKLAVVEQLRKVHGIRGAVSEFRVDEQECMVLFKGPGYAADIYVNRADGTYTATQTAMGAVAIINDLHKGRDSGLGWSILIDVTALVMLMISITGIVLIFYIKRRRWSGTLTAVFGTILLVIVYLVWVP